MAVFPEAMRTQACKKRQANCFSIRHAAPTEQGTLWRQRQRSENPILNCRLSLRVMAIIRERLNLDANLPNSTDLARNVFREDVQLTGIPGIGLRKKD
jgi:hypothetical protein